ncbi:hypothetical protein AGRA3207_005541 [Actinomadura graeca]|uniref:Uncharacterized protein n=1 Tax=Actinomadura graeca TaxID=2750812 RepID=A0ABX8QZU4_9ACTN|nr:hypothetical protein [Actinomadura graeca]QXJ24257.1 hypothetical protein AGRA3207_005541 [Actinomadura graeca]
MGQGNEPGGAAMGNRLDGIEQRHARPRLTELKAVLEGHRFSVDFETDPLRIVVTRPGDRTGARQTVTCKPRVTDQDRMWFFDEANGEPIAEDTHIVDAAVIIAGNLSPAP